MQSGGADNLHQQHQLLMLRLSREDGHSSIQLDQYTPHRPHIYRSSEWYAEHDLWSSVEPRLYVSVNTLITETRASKVDNFNAWLCLVFE